MDRLPNLICPGAMKSGTSTLYEVLRQHPKVYMSLKEPHYFSLHFDRGIKFYRSLFKSSKNEKYRADMTPVYMLLDDVPGLIKDTLGDNIKFIFILRNPVDRAYSAYWMKKLELRDDAETFEEALALEETRILRGKMELIDYSYKTRGLYAKQIKNFLKYFPKENMYFMIFEDFIKDIEGESKKLFEFLAIEKDIEINYNLWVNKPQEMKNPLLVKFFRKSKGFLTKITSARFTKNMQGPLINGLKRIVLKRNEETVAYTKNPKTCKKLMIEFTEDIKELEKIIGRDLNLWIDKYSEV